MQNPDPGRGGWSVTDAASRSRVALLLRRKSAAAMAGTLPSLSDATLGFLTVNTVFALYRSRRDPWAAGFVALAYVTLWLLLHCLRALERVPLSQPRRRERLKLAVLGLATALNVIFSHQVSKILPPGLRVVVWSLAASVAAGGICAFYFAPQQPCQAE